jgi:ADP-ribose pyrophosphatase
MTKSPSPADWQMESSKVIFESKHTTVVLREASTGDETVDKEVVERKLGVTMVLHVPTGVVLQRHMRLGAATVVLELPAGAVNKHDANPEVAARRELEEECGWVGGDLEPLGDIWTSPGWTNEQTAFFDVTGGSFGDDDRGGSLEESMQNIVIAEKDIPRMVRSGGICDAKTIVGLALAGLI